MNISNDINYKIDSQNTKNSKRIIISILVAIILITALSLILVLCLKKTKKRSVRINSENINILPPLVLNSTSGNHTHTIIFIPGFSSVPEDFVVAFTNRLNYTKKTTQML